MIANAQTLAKLEIKSTLCQKLDPEERRKLNRAIVDRTLPTYKSCYEHFRLADRGIGFFAFYRYARRLRDHVAAAQLAALTMPDAPPTAVVDAVIRMLAHRLLDAAFDESASPKTIERLAQAYRNTIQTQSEIQRAAIREQKAALDRQDDDVKEFRAIIRRLGQRPAPHSPAGAAPLLTQAPADPQPTDHDPSAIRTETSVDNEPESQVIIDDNGEN